jgi:D-tagatose-1,6-bisphosphate aldolase subunit GatZ/KbaZ
VAFDRAGLGYVWPQVMALVVQPGVESDLMRVVDYRPGSARDLATILDDEPQMTFEAHSTDYQTRMALSALVMDGWRLV